jgi:hypothetical protein
MEPGHEGSAKVIDGGMELKWQRCRMWVEGQNLVSSYRGGWDMLPRPDISMQESYYEYYSWYQFGISSTLYSISL